jgi:hypothetical protein
MCGIDNCSIYETATDFITTVVESKSIFINSVLLETIAVRSIVIVSSSSSANLFIHCDISLYDDAIAFAWKSDWYSK